MRFDPAKDAKNLEKHGLSLAFSDWHCWLETFHCRFCLAQ